MRPLLVLAHRYAGLGLAVFLALAGLSGSLIAWHEELDARLNPQWFRAPTPGTPLPLPELARRFQAQVPQAELRLMLLPRAPGETARAFVRGWPGETAEHPQNQVFLDPVNGAILGHRSTTAPRLARGELLPWIYRFHHSLMLGGLGSTLLGIIALVWLLDCFAGFALTLPRGRPLLRKWRPAWGVQRKRLNYDLHRASGLWLWPLLAVLAFSGVYFNLRDEVFEPLLRPFTPLTARPFQDPLLAAPLREPALDWAQAIAGAENSLRDIDHRLAYVGYDAARGYYRMGFHTPGDLMADRAGTVVTLSGADGRVRELRLPGSGSAGDRIMDWQFPLHSGRALGVSGRVLISIAGLGVALLSVTGVAIWLRKRRAAAHVAGRHAAVAGSAPVS